MPRFAEVLCFLIFFSCLSLQAQDRATLEKQRQKLEQQIRETTTLLKKSQKEKEATVSNLQMLRSEIAMREEVVTSLKKELQLIDGEINGHEKALDKLEMTMKELRSDQAVQMRNAFLEQQMSHPLLFILSAQNLNEAFLRWQYQNRIQHARKRTHEELNTASADVRKELSALEHLKVQKQGISTDMEEQEGELRKSAGTAQSMVTSLEKKERSLRNQLEKQQKESKQLALEIERIIAAEIKKSTGTESVPAAPALKALSTEFARNKGKLPWPVDHGLITGKFGAQPHPIVKTITISNNGIDITAPQGSDVRSIFGGKVVGRKFIPGFDHMVIIQHGSFYTVYSRLAEVFVEINDEVDARKQIGRLAKTGDENPKLHLEIWENKIQLDPEHWISR
jgi:septal ring factor EnvC (AmiA/AmiB activator)